MTTANLETGSSYVSSSYSSNDSQTIPTAIRVFGDGQVNQVDMNYYVKYFYTKFFNKSTDSGNTTVKGIVLDTCIVKNAGLADVC